MAFFPESISGTPDVSGAAICPFREPHLARQLRLQPDAILQLVPREAVGPRAGSANGHSWYRVERDGQNFDLYTVNLDNGMQFPRSVADGWMLIIHLWLRSDVARSVEPENRVANRL